MFFEVAKILGLSADKDYNYNAQSGEIDFDNGAKVILKDLFLYPSDPNFDSLGSLEITGAFIDDCNQIVYKAWQIVTSRCRFKLNEFGIIPKVLGSCNPSKNWTYQNFYKPDRDKDLEIDVVVAVPDSSNIQALGYAQARNITFEMALINEISPYSSSEKFKPIAFRKRYDILSFFILFPFVNFHLTIPDRTRKHNAIPTIHTR